MKIRLSTRLILSVVLIEAIMLSTLVWNSVRLIGSSHAEVLEHNLNEEAELLASLVAPGLAVNDRAILQDALSLLENNENIEYIAIEDISGNTMATLGYLPEEFIADQNYDQTRQNGVFDVIKRVSLSKQALGTLKIGYSTAYVESLIRQTRVQNTSIALVELILSIVMTLLVAIFLTRGLRKLEEGARALTRDELEHRIDLNSRDELGDLAQSFNALARHLSQTRKELADEHDALEKQTQRLTTLLDGVDAVVADADPENCQFKYVSKEAENLLGYPLTEWFSPLFLEKHIYSDDLDYFREQRALHNKQPGTATIDFRLTHQNGSLLDIRSINTFDYDEVGSLTCRSLFIDITEQKHNEKRIAYLAEHDVLTGLFNRHRFQEELERAISYAERFEQQGALMFIDLDQFKYINDTLGHHAGDEYLSTIARRLSGNLRKVDVLGRLGGDEFGIVLPNTNQAEAEQAAKHLMKALTFHGSGETELETPVTASVGIVIFPEHGSVPSHLLALADAAMYSAKEKGRNTYHLYNERDNQLKSMHAKLEWEQRIRLALQHNLFVLHFQPIFGLNSRTVTHYEVLLRMNDGEGGLIPPNAFLDIAERFGMIRDIDEWVLRNAIAIQAESCIDGDPICLAINLSGRHFGKPDILEWIKQYITQSGADPSMLIFEITETAAVENINQAHRFTDALHAIGCRIAIDDFGVGFTSFNYLKQLPVDIIKLDGSFIQNLANDKFDRVFVEAMSAMSKGLGIACVAEFVESEEVIDVLNELDVDMGQGFHLARPEAEFIYPCDLVIPKLYQCC